MSYIMRSVASTRGRKLDAVPELYIVIYGENSRTWKIFLTALQFFVANYHSTQAPYSYVIRFWCNGPIWDFSAKKLFRSIA